MTQVPDTLLAMEPVPATAGLALGTVQFGIPYGLKRPQSPVPSSEVTKILSLAWDSGIDLLDTAADYGDAESVIAALRPTQARFRIVSKAPAMRPAGTTQTDVDRVIAQVRESLTRLQVERLDALLVHHAPDLLGEGGAALHRGLSHLQSDGLIGRIGISVYDSATMRRVIDEFRIDVVQLPLNVLDQRFVQDGSLDMLSTRRVETHVRSAFLQGVLLTDPDRLPVRFEGLRTHLAGFHADASRAGLSRAAAALGFLRHIPSVGRIVIGVESVADLQENLRAFDDVALRSPALDYGRYAIDDRAMTDPRQW